MTMEFFSASEVIQRVPVTSDIPKCGACGLYKTCRSPKMPVTGQGRKGILIVAEAPGREEDERNEQLVGPAGQLLRESMQKVGLDLDRDCWKTNALVCRPPENATPTNEQIDWCRPNLNKTIAELNPQLIMPLGGPAVRSLLGPLWRDDVGSISQWVGWKIPAQRYNAWITPGYHPSYVKRALDNTKEGPAVKVWFDRHIKRMSQIEGRPFEKIPDYKSQVKLIYDHEQAARMIRKYTEYGGVSSFDYETDRLKPDSPDSEIVSCAICWRGEEAIAFPWVGEVIPAMRDYLKSSNPKVGANIKFEDRWTEHFFGFFVNNFIWDCVNDAHILDNRDKITSVKFQAFVRLGQEPWDIQVKPFLESKDGLSNSKNNIRKVDLRSLLTYNGIDAIVEYFVAYAQKQEMEMDHAIFD